MPGELYLMWQQYPWTFGEVLQYLELVLVIFVLAIPIHLMYTHFSSSSSKQFVFLNIVSAVLIQHLNITIDRAEDNMG